MGVRAIALFAAITPLLCAFDAAAETVLLVKPSPDSQLEGPLDVEQAIRNALIGRAPRLIERGRTAELFAKSREFGLPCDAIDETCALAFAQIAGADEAMVAVVERAGPAHVLRLTRLDVSGTRQPARAGGRIDKNGAVDAAAVEVIGRALFGEPNKALVPVRVALNPPSAAVLVDNQPITLDGGVAWVAPGRRVFQARAAGTRSSATLDVPGDGSVTDVALEVGAATDPAQAATTTTGGTAPGALSTSTGATPPGAPAGSSLPTIAVVGGAVLGIGGAAMWIGADNILGQPLEPPARVATHVLGIGGAGLVVVGTGATLFGAWTMLSEP